MAPAATRVAAAANVVVVPLFFNVVHSCIVRAAIRNGEVVAAGEQSTPFLWGAGGDGDLPSQYFYTCSLVSYQGCGGRPSKGFPRAQRQA
jgi:hypothetical protein